MFQECPVATEADYTQQLLGAAALYIPIGAREDAAGFLSVAVDTIAGQATGQTVTVKVFGQQPTDTFTVGYGNWVTKEIRGKFILVTGNGATIELKVSPVRIDVAPITLPVATQVVSIPAPITAIVADATGDKLGVPYTGGVPAPASGIWEFNAFVAAAGTALSVNDGGGAVLLLPVGTNAAPTTQDLQTYRVQVTAGTTYTITGGTVKSGAVGGAG